MFSGRDSRLRRQIGDLVVDGRVIIKVEIECKGAKSIYRVQDKAVGRIFDEHNKLSIPQTDKNVLMFWANICF